MSNMRERWDGRCLAFRKILKIIIGLNMAGMGIARLNFSGDSQEHHREWITAMRQLSSKSRKPVAALRDLTGLKSGVEFWNHRKGFISLEPGPILVPTNDQIMGRSEGFQV